MKIQNKEKPNILILSTGGTITGGAKSRLDEINYKSRYTTINSLIQCISEIKNLANITSQQIANIDSANMTDDIWLQLAKTINKALLNSKINGIIITHGTDTLEESAYFLSLVVKNNKPIIVTGNFVT